MRLDVRDLALLAVLGYFLVPQVQCGFEVLARTLQRAPATWRQGWAPDVVMDRIFRDATQAGESP